MYNIKGLYSTEYNLDYSTCDMQHIICHIIEQQLWK